MIFLQIINNGSIIWDGITAVVSMEKLNFSNNTTVSLVLFTPFISSLCLYKACVICDIVSTLMPKSADDIPYKLHIKC